MDERVFVVVSWFLYLFGVIHAYLGIYVADLPLSVQFTRTAVLCVIAWIVFVLVGAAVQAALETPEQAQGESD